MRLMLADPDRDQAGWPAERSERTFQLSDSPATDPTFTIDRHPVAGYRVWIERLGHLTISPDGSQIACSPPESASQRWRLLLGQGLPIAAALRGLEVLHASAVVFEDQVLAFAGRSGTGKTSLALNLLAHGGKFLADDVVALEVENDVLLAHPGISVAHVHGSEQTALRAAGIPLPGPMNPDMKQHVLLPLWEDETPLGRLYFLNRAEANPSIQITRMKSPDPGLLLAATFVTHVPLASRLTNQLEVCARVARTIPTFEIQAPLWGSSTELATQVARHASAPR